MDKFSTVYFSKDLDSENIYEMYTLLNRRFSHSGRTCIKVHTGELGNKNFLTADYLEDFINKIGNATVVECNTAYNGERNTTEKHLKLLKKHGWNRFNVEILDDESILDLNINGKILKKNLVGKKIENYDNCIVISHFKAHPMGGFGGALKQLSIGFASSKGKQLIHGHGNLEIGRENLKNVESDNQDAFIDCMADAAASVVNYFGNEHIAYINILKNISESCDCDSNAPEPCMKDIGILSSLDPVAIDQVSIDMIRNSNDPGKDKILSRIESRNGERILESAEKLGIGNRSYRLVTIAETEDE